MSVDERIEEERREKRTALAELGVDTYPTKFERTHTVSDAFAAFSDKTAEELEAAPSRVRTAGRIVACDPELRQGGFRST